MFNHVTAHTNVLNLKKMAQFFFKLQSVSILAIESQRHRQL